jgi:hypothetical protein
MTDRGSEWLQRKHRTPYSKRRSFADVRMPLASRYLMATMGTGYFMQNPPGGWQPAGWAPGAAQTAQRAAMDYTLGP